MEKVKKLLDKIIQASNDKKATNIVAFNVSEKSDVTDFIVVLGATNKIHCKAIFETAEKEIEDFLKVQDSDDLYLPKISGRPDSGWVVLDVNSIIVHVICEEIRDFYALENIYSKTSVIYHH
jgi:ribosome-associated protein